MKVLNKIKAIRCAQAKILAGLLSAPFHKLSIYVYTEFDKMFRLDEEENENFNLAWTLLKEEDLVYTDVHEMGIKEDAILFANRFVKTIKGRLHC